MQKWSDYIASPPRRQEKVELTDDELHEIAAEEERDRIANIEPVFVP